MTDLRMTLDRLAYRVPEVAKMLGVSRSIVYDWVEAGTLPHIKVGRTVMIPAGELEDWLARQTRRKAS